MIRENGGFQRGDGGFFFSSISEELIYVYLIKEKVNMVNMHKIIRDMLNMRHFESILMFIVSHNAEEAELMKHVALYPVRF